MTTEMLSEILLHILHEPENWHNILRANRPIAIKKLNIFYPSNTTSRKLPIDILTGAKVHEKAIKHNMTVTEKKEGNFLKGLLLHIYTMEYYVAIKN